MTRLTRLAMVIPVKTDATSLYRAIGPFSLLQKQTEGLMLAEIETLNWASLSMVDAVFMQRPWTEQHLQIAEIVKRQRIPLWVDYDDDLFCVPRWNPVYDSYMGESRQKALARIIAMADVVTVSTDQIKTNFAPLNQNIITIPNAWNDHLFPHVPRTTKERKKLITWRGSHTHRNDLQSVENAIVSLAQEHPDVTWNFIGENPWFTSRMPGNSAHITPAMDPLDYWAMLRNIEPSIHIVPLEDCMFNRCKSNIAWQEATMAGAVTLAPDFPEFIRPGVINYSDEGDFRWKLKSLMNGELDFESLHAQSLACIRDTLSLSQVNELRFKVLNSALGI